MKTLLLLLLTTSAIGQELSGTGKYVKENYSKQYEATIKKHALLEWGTDYNMVVWEINSQVDALIELIQTFETKHTRVVFDAIREWSQDGYEGANEKIIKAMPNFSITELLRLHCDWKMVVWEYKKQVKAKGSF